MEVVVVIGVLLAIVLVIKLFEKPKGRSKEEVAVLMERTLAGDDHAWDELISVPLADPDLDAIRKECLQLDPMSERQVVLPALIKKLRATRWLAVALTVALSLDMCGVAEGQEAREPARSLQVMIAPEGRLYAPDPIHISLKKHDQVRWVCKSGVIIIFRLEGFPLLADGTRVRIPPFVKMSYSKEPMPRWFPECQETFCDSGSINPQLEDALKHAPAGNLEYVYRIKRDSAQPAVEARLVVEP